MQNDYKLEMRVSVWTNVWVQAPSFDRHSEPRVPRARHMPQHHMATYLDFATFSRFLVSTLAMFQLQRLR